MKRRVRRAADARMKSSVNGAERIRGERAAQPACAEIAADAAGFVASGLYGCLVCASNRGVSCAAGSRTLRAGDPFPADFDSRFDLASVGKTHTAALCALLYADGLLDPDAPFTEYLPDHALAKEGCRITVRDLATHTGGFDNSKPYMVPDAEEHFGKLMAKRPVWDRGTRFCYACSNFCYLGMIVERITGLDLDAAATKLLWSPLGMNRTTWKVCTGDPNVVACHGSTCDGPRRRPGERNDLCAHYAGRPMGNGANFSTCRDMLAFTRDLFERRTFKKECYDLLFAESANVDGRRRSFGWDMASGKSTFSVWTRTGFSERAIVHTGWTGSAIAVDPDCGFAGVVLGSRLACKEATMRPRMRLLESMRAAAGRAG